MSLRARRAPRTLVAALAGGVLLVAALAACAGDDVSTPGPSTTAGPATEEPTPEPTTEPTTVELSASGVGDIPWDQPDALPALEELLGPADGVEDFPAECGLAETRTARWGALTVGIQSGALLSWQVDARGSVPSGVALPSGVGVGSPMSDVAALPGAQPAVFRDNWQVFEVQVSDPAEPESVFYWVEGDAPESPVTMVVGRSVLGCG